MLYELLVSIYFIYHQNIYTSSENFIRTAYINWEYSYVLSEMCDFERHSLASLKGFAMSIINAKLYKSFLQYE